MFYYSDIIAIKNSYWFFSFTKINYGFRLVIFCVVILCVNRSRSSFILYRIVKRHSRQSNVRRIWTCADNEFCIADIRYMKMKICKHDAGHMTKMAAMPIFGKNPSKSSSLEPAG